MITNNNPRLMAVRTLNRVHDGAYSNLQLNSVINNSKMDHRNIALMTNIVYGVLQHRLTLEFDVAPFLKNPNKIKSWVLDLIYTAIYQMKYLDRIPKRAIFNESIKIAKRLGNNGTRKLVTGILHQMDRSGFPSTKTISPYSKRLSIEYSVPTWIIEQLFEQVGEDKTVSILKNINLPSKQSVRVNQHLITIKNAIVELKAEHYEVKHSAIAKAGLILSGKPATLSSLFKTGKITIQDESAMIPVEVMNVHPDDHVLDACAAPGGKTTQIAEHLSDAGQVDALDLHSNKIRKINQNAKRMSLNSKINAFSLDARDVYKRFKDDYFDKILVDAPCSGMGLIQRKPEIRYEKNISDINKLSDVQLQIMDAVAPKLKSSGTIVYSTCTIFNQENINVINHFLNKHPEFKLQNISQILDFDKNRSHEKYLRIFPDDFNSDGFFVCKLMKK